MYRPYSSTVTDARPFRDVESQIRDLTQDFTTSFNTANYDLAAGLFAEYGALIALQYEAAYGQRPIEKVLRQMGEQGYGALRMETMRVEHSGDMTMEIGRFSVVAHTSEGITVPECGKYVRVWRRLGAWLIIADCWNRTALNVSDRAA